MHLRYLDQNGRRFPALAGLIRRRISGDNILLDTTSTAPGSPSSSHSFEVISGIYPMLQQSPPRVEGPPEDVDDYVLENRKVVAEAVKEKCKFEFLNTHLLEQLECVICIETMTDPITMCVNGHLICRFCRPRLSHCHLCRGSLTPMRNFVAEKMSTLLRSRCRYTKFGCTVFMNPNSLKDHEPKCTFIPVKCIAGHSQKEIPHCGWKGILNELFAHVQREHGKNMVHVQSEIRGLETHNTDFISVHLMSVYGELFWLCTKFDEKEAKFYELLQFIGSLERAKDFSYEITLMSSECNTSLTFCSKTSSCFEDPEVIFASKKCFQHNIDVMKSLFGNHYGFLPLYKLTINVGGNRFKG